jgi:hypothetical protein
MTMPMWMFLVKPPCILNAISTHHSLEHLPDELIQLLAAACNAIGFIQMTLQTLEFVAFTLCVQPVSANQSTIQSHRSIGGRIRGFRTHNTAASVQIHDF